jgi:hypothetical protein
VRVETRPVTHTITSLAHENDHLFAVGTSDVHVFDVSISGQPALVGTAATSGNANAATVGGAELYVGLDQGMEVFDVSDPARPRSVGVFTSERFVAMSATDGLVIAQSGRGVHVFRYARIDGLVEVAFSPALRDGLVGVLSGNVVHVSDDGLSVHAIESTVRVTHSVVLPTTLKRQ